MRCQIKSNPMHLIGKWPNSLCGNRLGRFGQNLAIGCQGGLVVNIGEHTVSAGGARPDYFGASISKVPGRVENAVITFVKDGKRYTLGSASGEATAAGGTFSESLMRGGGTANGSFSC